MIWFRIALCAVVFRFWPTAGDPMWRGKPTWRVAWDWSRKSYGV